MRVNLVIVKKLIKFARDTWIILGIALLMLVAIEACFLLAFYMRSFWHPPYADYRIKADTYSDTSWVASYVQEHEQLGNPRWKSYVYWRRPPYSGKYINTDSDGIRKTYNPPAPEGASSRLKIFMFGGSTMFGSGEKDDSTIPSIFAREARREGINCEVVNYGQEAYVSTQEVIELMLRLQKGDIPDVVIFYDGVNDTFGPFQLGVAGLPHNEFNREKEFNLLEKRSLVILSAQSAIKHFYTVRFLNGALKKLGLHHETTQLIPLEYEKQTSDKAALARAAVETYLSNIRLIHALSKAYGFKCLFYWQPTIYQKKQLTEYERKAMEVENKYTGIQEFYMNTYTYMQQRTAGMKTEIAFHDISSIFSNVHEPIYIDLWHLGERGNSLIARRMLEDLVRLLPQREVKSDQVEQGTSTRKGDRLYAGK